MGRPSHVITGLDPVIQPRRKNTARIGSAPLNLAVVLDCPFSGIASNALPGSGIKSGNDIGRAPYA